MKKIIFSQPAIEAIEGLNIVCIDASECVATDETAAKCAEIYSDLGLEGDIEIEEMPNDEFEVLPDFIKSQL